MLPLTILLIICAAVSSLPPKGCTSCKNVWQETVHEHAGQIKLEKVIGSKGCFVQKATCSPLELDGFSFLQLNFGATGFGKQGAQTVEFQCNERGQWTLEQSGSSMLVVDTISCHST